MKALDTETTGLYFTHGCQTFAIGVYDGEDTAILYKPINPYTRERFIPYTNDEKQALRSIFDSDLVVMHNSLFDVKALVEAGVFHPEEPEQPEFWERIIDTTILAHLHNNTDSGSLKDLTPQYLGREYRSEDRLNTLVNKCRQFIRTRNPLWSLSNENCPQLKPSGSNPKWWKSDMWLPNRVLVEFGRKALMDYGLDPDECVSCVNDYLRDDCINTYDLATVMLDNIISEFGDDAMDMLRVNNQVLHVIYKMERHGVTVRPSEIDNAIGVCDNWIKTLTARTEELSGVEKITDTKLRKILFTDYNLPAIKNTASGASSVDADSIIRLKKYCIENGSKSNSLYRANEFLTKIIALKKYNKKKGYLTAYRNSELNGVIYPSYHITGTSTLRMSVKNPATQTVTKGTNPFEDEFEDISELLAQSPPLRSIMGPKENRWWLCNDYSQLQLRIFAVATQEEEMIEAFRKGWDAHDYTARKIFGLSDRTAPSKNQRRIAKNVNFGFIFGASPAKIETTAGMVGLWDTVQQMFPNAHDFIESQKNLLKLGERVRTLGGYPLDVPLKQVKWKAEAEKAAHAAVCYIVQGSEGEIVKEAMRMADDYLTQYYPTGRLCLQVHDELVFDMAAKFPKKHGRELKDIMEAAAAKYGVHAPVNCELCVSNWSSSKDLVL